MNSCGERRGLGVDPRVKPEDDHLGGVRRTMASAARKTGNGSVAAMVVPIAAVRLPPLLVLKQKCPRGLRQ